VKNFFEDELALAVERLPHLEVLGADVYSEVVTSVREAIRRPLATVCLGGATGDLDEVIAVFDSAPIQELRVGKTALEAWDAPEFRAVRPGQGAKLRRV